MREVRRDVEVEEGVVRGSQRQLQEQRMRL